MYINSTYGKFMNERDDRNVRVHRVHVVSDEKKFFSSEAADVEVERRLFGSDVKKIKSCTKCYTKHNGSCYGEE